MLKGGTRGQPVDIGQSADSYWTMRKGLGRQDIFLIREPYWVILNQKVTYGLSILKGDPSKEKTNRLYLYIRRERAMFVRHFY